MDRRERFEAIAQERHSGGEHRVPNLRSACSGHAQPTESELSFTNPMDQLDSRDGAHGVLELLESQHRPEARLDVAVILLNDIVEILARADRDGPQLLILGPKLANGPMGGPVSVEIPCQLSSPYVGRIERLVALENAVREHEHFAHDGGHSDDFRLASRKEAGIAR